MKLTTETYTNGMGLTFEVIHLPRFSESLLITPERQNELELVCLNILHTSLRSGMHEFHLTVLFGQIFEKTENINEVIYTFDFLKHLKRSLDKFQQMCEDLRSPNPMQALAAQVTLREYIEEYVGNRLDNSQRFLHPEAALKFAEMFEVMSDSSISNDSDDIDTVLAMLLKKK